MAKFIFIDRCGRLPVDSKKDHEILKQTVVAINRMVQYHKIPLEFEVFEKSPENKGGLVSYSGTCYSITMNSTLEDGDEENL